MLDAFRNAPVVALIASRKSIAEFRITRKPVAKGRTSRSAHWNRPHSLAGIPWRAQKAP